MIFISIFSYLDNHKIRPTELMVTEYETASFVCVTIIKTKWFFNDGPLPSNVNDLIDKMGLRGIIIYNTTRRNQGYYECEGQNLFQGSFHARSFLIVEGE